MSNSLIEQDISHFVINPAQWKYHLPYMPEEGRKILEEEIENTSGPTALILHPKHGYIILMSGQGSFMQWAENEDLVKEYNKYN